MSVCSLSVNKHTSAYLLLLSYQGFYIGDPDFSHYSISTIMPDTVDPPAPLVNPVSVKLPDFWAEDPRTWFCQAEAQFRISRVSSESLKFDYVIQKLPSDVIKRVRDLVNNPPEAGRYSVLKDRLLSMYKKSNYEELRDFSCVPALGDRRPSVLMDDLLCSIPSLDTSGAALPFVVYAFLSRLPDSLRSLVSSVKYEDSLQALAEQADRLWTASGGSSVYSAAQPVFVGHAVRPHDDDDSTPDLEVQAVLPRAADRSSGRQRPPPQQHRHLCFPHRKYRAQAINCRHTCDSCSASCSWVPGNSQAAGRRN